MYAYLFNWIAISSFGALPFILFFILMRAVFSVKIPPVALLMLYVLALFKILSPFQIRSSFSILQFIFLPAASLTDIYAFAEKHQDGLMIAWAIGFIAIVSVYSWCYFHGTRGLCKDLQDICPDDLKTQVNELASRYRLGFPIQISVSEKLGSPILCRLKHPVVALPKSYIVRLSSEQLKCILAHELAHLRGHDILCNVMMSAIVALFWFNPCIWLLAAVFKCDREIIADQCALSGASNSERLAYGQCLLACAELSTRASSSAAFFAYQPPSFSYGSSLKRRIHYILQDYHTTAPSVVISALIVILALLVFFPTPSATSRLSENEYISPVSGAALNGNLIDSALHGIYFQNPNKNPIRASRSGSVVKTGYSDTIGTFVMLDHGDGITTVYGNLSEVYRVRGENIAQGQILGYCEQRDSGEVYFRISDTHAFTSID